MACGTPVITTNVAGCAPDLIEEGVSGFLVPPKNVSALTNAMARVAADTELNRSMKKRCSEVIRSFSPEAWAEGVAQALKFVCARAA
jgi:glycosyltransferase involved in cell wall biosynthesis